MSMRILSITLLLFLLFLCFQASVGNRRYGGRRPPPPCCVKFTTDNITNNVTGNTYIKQSADGPCVEAIILTTDRGPACFDPNSEWVKTITANMTKL